MVFLSAELHLVLTPAYIYLAHLVKNAEIALAYQDVCWCKCPTHARHHNTVGFLLCKQVELSTNNFVNTELSVSEIRKLELESENCDLDVVSLAVNILFDELPD